MPFSAKLDPEVKSYGDKNIYWIKKKPQLWQSDARKNAMTRETIESGRLVV